MTVYERDDRAGGLLAYGIPDFKMAKVYVERRIDQLEEEGVRFILNAEIGRTIDPHDSARRHDAILLTIGATVSRDLKIPGRDLRGIERAMPFLTQQNRRNLGTLNGETPILATGKSVIVIGGGDTAADCLGTCHRQQARSVMQLDYNPPRPRARTPTHPGRCGPRSCGLPPPTRRAASGTGKSRPRRSSATIEATSRSCTPSVLISTSTRPASGSSRRSTGLS